MQPVDQSGDELHFNGNRKSRKEARAETTRQGFNENEGEGEEERYTRVWMLRGAKDESKGGSSGRG